VLSGGGLSSSAIFMVSDLSPGELRRCRMVGKAEDQRQNPQL
jgi:hypothetical protein